MRKIIAALITSLDGLIEGPNGELDWVDFVGMFKDVTERQALTLLDAKPLQSGMVRLTYRAGAFDMSETGAV